MTSGEHVELRKAIHLLQEWEKNATEQAKKELSKNLPHEVQMVSFVPTPTSLLGRTRAFLGMSNDKQENKEG